MYFKDIPEAARRRPVRHLLQVPRCNFARVLEQQHGFRKPELPLTVVPGGMRCTTHPSSNSLPAPVKQFHRRERSPAAAPDDFWCRRGVGGTTGMSPPSASQDNRGQSMEVCDAQRGRLPPAFITSQWDLGP